MIISLPFALLISIIAGCTNAILLYFGKHIAWIHKKPHLDIMLSSIRFIIFATFVYAVLQFMPSNSILLLIIFLLSYIGTIISITHTKIHNEKR